MSKFGDDIRRISKYQELLTLIQSKNSTVNQVTNGAISGARGVAYAVAGSLDSKGSTGTVGVSKPNNNGVVNKDKDATDKDKDKKEGDQNKGDSDNKVGNNDLSSDDNTNRDGWYDADSVLEGALDALGKAPPKEGDGKTINALTGIKTDDLSRKLVAILKEATNGMIGDPDNDSLNEQRIDPGYVAGQYYRVSESPDLVDVVTVSKAQAEGKRYLDSILAPPRPPVSFVGWYDVSNNPSTPPDTVGVPKLARYVDTQTNISSVTVNFLLCTSTPSASGCPLLPPSVQWADLGATQLAWVTTISAQVSPFTYDMVGKFMPHPYDANVPQVYENGASILDFTSNLGNTIRLGPLAAAGWYMYYRDPMTGLPSGSSSDASVLKINADRTHGGFITPSELSKSLPN